MADGAFRQSFYTNNTGQLNREIDPDSVATLYNAQGELAYTAIDLDRDNQINWSGTDRITQTLNDVIANHGTNVRRTRTYVYPNNGSSATLLVSTVETSTDGLRAWQTTWNGANGVTTESQTTYDAQNHWRIVTVTAPEAH